MEDNNVQEKITELLENKRFSDLRKMLEDINSTDLSLLLGDFSVENMSLTFRLLSKDQAAETFSYMESDLQEKLILSLTDKELKEVINELFLDDTVDLIEEMPSNVVKRILRTIAPSQRKIVNEFLNYPSDSARKYYDKRVCRLKRKYDSRASFSENKENRNR